MMLAILADSMNTATRVELMAQRRECSRDTRLQYALQRRRCASLWRRVVDQLHLWSSVRRERQLLSQLNRHMLNDIGLSEAQVSNEIARPFYDISTRR